MFSFCTLLSLHMHHASSAPRAFLRSLDKNKRLFPFCRLCKIFRLRYLLLQHYQMTRLAPRALLRGKNNHLKKISKEGRKRWREQSRGKNLYGKKEKKMKRKKEGVKLTKILVNFVRSGVKSFSSRSGSIDFEPRMFFRPSLSLSQQVHMMLLTKKKDK